MNAPVHPEHRLPGLDHRHLDGLDEEAIFILHEVAASCERPALLFSDGKDSCVVLRLAEKAFEHRVGGAMAGDEFRGRLPFPLLHVDTGDNSPEVIEFRDRREGERPRMLWGRIAHGQVRIGDEVQVCPGDERARVAGLQGAGSQVQVVTTAQSAGVVLDRQLDVSRGDWLAAPERLLPVHRFEATLAWLDTEAASPGRKHGVRQGNRWVHARLAAIEHRRDIHTLQPRAAEHLAVSDTVHVVFELQPLPLARGAAA